MAQHVTVPGQGLCHGLSDGDDIGDDVRVLKGANGGISKGCKAEAPVNAA